MILDKFHIAQRDAMAEDRALRVGGDDATQRALAEDAAGTAGCDDHRFALDHGEFTGRHFDRDDALAAPVFFEDVDTEMFVETLDRRELNRGLEQSVQNVETRLVRREPGPLDLHAAKRARIDLAVRSTAPRATPVLELGQLNWCLLDEVLDDVLFAQPVATTDGVVEVVVETIFLALDACRAALGGNGMAAHRIDLRYQCDLQRRI